MQPQIELAFLEVEVPDPTSLSSFFGDVIGLMPGESSTPDTVTWRNDQRAQRLVVTKGDANDATTIGFEAVDTAAFDATVARLTGIGCEVTEGDDAHCGLRKVKRLASTTAPWGVSVEIVQNLEDAATAFTSDLMPSGFHTEGVGFGHVVFATPAFDESARFLTEGLGLAQSDWLEMEIMEGIELEVRFFHCNERHHTVALAKAPFEIPQNLHHVMFETTERDDVGAAFDRAWATELPIPNGLGRHDNDKMFSFYVQSPAGFQVEVGHGARLITDDWAENRAYDRISLWGHQPLRS